LETQPNNEYENLIPKGIKFHSFPSTKIKNVIKVWKTLKIKIKIIWQFSDSLNRVCKYFGDI